MYDTKVNNRADWCKNSDILFSKANTFHTIYDSIQNDSPILLFSLLGTYDLSKFSTTSTNCDMNLQLVI